MQLYPLRDGRMGAHMPDSPIGELKTAVGPIHPTILRDHVLLDGIATRLEEIAAAAAQHVGQVVAAHSEVCARCARTAMRAVMGDRQARAIVEAAAAGHPAKPGDAQRYGVVDRYMRRHIVATRQAVAGLSAQLAAGDSRAVVEQVMTRATEGNRWAQRYLTGADGAPMKMSQWGEFKSCACAPPSGGKSTPLPRASMVGSIPSLLEVDE